MTPVFVPAQRLFNDRVQAARGRILAAAVEQTEDRLKREIRSLRQANESLKYSLSNADRVNAELRQEVIGLRQRVGDVEAERGELHVLLGVVLDVTKLERNDVLSVRRTIPAGRARQIFYWIAKRATPYSYPEIARFCNRDHTSVLHGVQKIHAIVHRLGPPSEDTPIAWAKHLHEGWGR